ncbi:MAG: TnsA-like heteromeric transposase endonuclease subunit [Streptosporangiaceae bacterium]
MIGTLRDLAATVIWGQVDAGSAVVRVRRADQTVEDHPWGSAGVDLLAAAAPWRVFRWYQGQQHFSGTYWSSTQRDHVIYESRLELAVLLLADSDPQVSGIVAQPFLLRAEVGGVVRKHIPDYLLLTDAGPVVVDVKPRHRLAKPEVALTFGWTRTLVEERGWRYEVRCEPSAARLENVRFLAGYRRDWLFDPGLLARLREANLDGASLGEAFGCLPSWPEPLVRAAVLHLVWAGHFTVDLDQPLSGSHRLRAAR